MTLLSYPSQINKGDNDYIMFTAHQYRTNKAYDGQVNKGGAAGPPMGSPIVLYMPNSTPGVTTSNNWGEARFEGPLGMLKANALSDLTGFVNKASGDMEQLGTSSTDMLKRQLENIKTRGAPAAKQGIISMLAQASGTTANQLMAMNSGKIYNPNIELLYEGPKLRNFGFAFNFIPKNPTETAAINSIIMEFKKWSSPKDNGAMFEVPCVWQVSYRSGGGQNKMMNAFKRAALTQVVVQANPSSDMHVAFGDGMPITTSIQLMFQEVDIITRQDHASAGTNQGY